MNLAEISEPCRDVEALGTPGWGLQLSIALPRQVIYGIMTEGVSTNGELVSNEYRCIGWADSEFFNSNLKRAQLLDMSQSGLKTWSAERARMNMDPKEVVIV